MPRRPRCAADRKTFIFWVGLGCWTTFSGRVRVHLWTYPNIVAPCVSFHLGRSWLNWYFTSFTLANYRFYKINSIIGISIKLFKDKPLRGKETSREDQLIDLKKKIKEWKRTIKRSIELLNLINFKITNKQIYNLLILESNWSHASKEEIRRNRPVYPPLVFHPQCIPHVKGKKIKSWSHSQQDK